MYSGFFDYKSNAEENTGKNYIFESYLKIRDNFKKI